GFRCHEDAFGRVDQLDFLLTPGHIGVSGIFHGHADGIFAVGHALVDLAGALGDDGVGRQLVQAFLTVDLVNAIDLIIGTARGGRVADDDLVLPLGVEQVLPALGGFFALELFVVDHDDHDVRVGADPQVVGAQKALVHAFGFGRIVGLEVVLERGHGAETGAPDHITQGVGGLGFDTLHERAGAGGDTLHGQI